MRKKIDEKMPKVSIITPLYNAEKYIAECIRSVQSQDMDDWEHLVIDDLSTDAGPEIVRKLAAEDGRVKYIKSETKLLASGARNVGLELAEGEYISFLDADDFWHPQKLSTQIMELEKRSADLTFSSYYICNASGAIIAKQATGAKFSSHNVLAKRTNIGCLTIMFSRKKFANFRFNTSLSQAEDFEMWCRISKLCGEAEIEVAQMETPLGYYRTHPAAKSKNKLKRIPVHWKIYSTHLKSGLLQSLYYTANYIIMGVIGRFSRKKGYSGELED